MTRKPPTPIGESFNPGGARWCPIHNGGRLECTKNRTKGRGPCHKPAIRGTDACDFHSGKTRAVAHVQGAAQITAWSALGEVHIDYRMAVMGVLQMTWMRLGAYGELLRRQVEADLPREGEPRERETYLGEEEMEILKKAPTGLIGHRYGAAGKEGHIYAQSEEVRALVLLEREERDRVVKYAKTAHDMGISQRMTDLAEKWGEIVAGQVSLLLDALHLTAEQSAAAPALIQAYLGAIDTGAVEDRQKIENIRG